jgi:RimJ/RimL family protein N-acetyltransferase
MNLVLPVEIANYPHHDVRIIDRGDFAGFLMRPLHPGDLEAEKAFIAALSARTMRDRTLGGIAEPTQAQLEQLVTPDYQNHFAFGIFTPANIDFNDHLVAEFVEDGVSEGGNHVPQLIAVGRLIHPISEAGVVQLPPPPPRDAEFALTIADQHQGHGLGRLLLEEIQRIAKRMPIQTLYGETFVTNLAMLALAQKAGFTIESVTDDETIRRMTWAC